MHATYHNHSDRSDGHSSISEIVSFAQTQDIDELGFSDHLCILPSGETSRISIPLDGLNEYVQEIGSFKHLKRPAIRLGIEVDWFQGQGDVIRNAMESVPFDYRIGGVHYVQENEIDKNSRYWKSKTQHERDHIYLLYWDLVRDMSESGLFDIVAHLDLPKKLGFYPQVDMTRPIREVLTSISRNNLVVEYNTAGFGKPCADGYPSMEILKMCRKMDIPATLSADAHVPQHLLFAFDKGIQRLMAAGYTEIARFKHRKISFEPLTGAQPEPFL
jgi:histidinol-phosphatase (PHP family)